MYQRKHGNPVITKLNFLLQIRRPYFHVKPLEKGQLKNWKEYLDFEIENGSHERVMVLFERCMIACALYEEFWLKVSNSLLKIPNIICEKFSY